MNNCQYINIVKKGDDMCSKNSIKEKIMLFKKANILLRIYRCISLNMNMKIKKKFVILTFL